MQKTYAVTGVASGIGAELARQLRSDGHQVVGYDVQDGAANVDHFIALDLKTLKRSSQPQNRHHAN